MDFDRGMNGDGFDAFAGSIPTRQKAQDARAREAEGYWFPLPLTGGFARVRLWSLADRALFGLLPSGVQAILADELGDRGSNGTARSQKALRDRLVNSMEEQEAVCNAFCVAGFLRPRLVASEAEIDPDDPYCLVASDLHMEERLDYLNLILAGEREASRRLRPFRAGPVEPVPGESRDEAPAASEFVSGAV